VRITANEFANAMVNHFAVCELFPTQGHAVPLVFNPSRVSTASRSGNFGILPFTIIKNSMMNECG
jgi:hypothetical protein